MQGSSAELKTAALTLLLALALTSCATTTSPNPETDDSVGKTQARPAPSTDMKLPYTARGQEPGWVLTLDKDGIAIKWDYGEKTAHAALPKPVPLGNGLRYTASIGATQLQASITHSICHDSMSGMPYPDHVRVTINGTSLEGCGGDPGSLLADTHWVIERINGDPVVGNTPLTLNFGTEGTLGGYAGCNSYSAQYRLDGEELRIGFMANTVKSCALPAIQIQKDESLKPSTQEVNLDTTWQENRLISVVGRAKRFDITADGKLVLRTDSGETLAAIPATRRN